TIIHEADELGLAFDRDARYLQMADQDAFMDVLRQREGERIACDALAEFAYGQLGGDAPRAPHGELLEPHAFRQHVFNDADLAMEFEGARLHRDRPRRLAGPRTLVDDADIDAEPLQPQSESETCGAGADDEDLRVGVRHAVLLLQIP